MYGHQRYEFRPVRFSFGSGGPPPRDILILLGVLFGTYSLQFFDSTRLLLTPLMLTPAAWRWGWVWQLGTYPFLGFPSHPFWFLLELLILFWFGRDVFRYLGRRSFWMLLAWGVLTASVVATGIHCLMFLARAADLGYYFPLLQGQRILLTILIAAFATIFGNATIYFMFVLPIRARWFLGLEILFAFMAFLTTKDLAGFLGICAAVGITYSTLAPGGLRRVLRQWRLRIERMILEARLRRQRRRRGIRIVDDDDRTFRVDDDDDDDDDDDNVRRGPWIN